MSAEAPVAVNPVVIVPQRLLLEGGSEYLFGVISRLCEYIDDGDGWGADGLIPEVVAYHVVDVGGEGDDTYVVLELEVVE